MLLCFPPFFLFLHKLEFAEHIFNLKRTLYARLHGITLFYEQMCQFEALPNISLLNSPITHERVNWRLMSSFYDRFSDLKINVRFIIVLNTKQCTLQSLISVLWVLQRNKTLSYLFQHLLQKTSIMHKNIWKSVILAIRDKNWHRTGKPYKVIMLKWTD